MRYFNTLPILSYEDTNGNNVALTNLLVRTSMVPELAKNPLLFYKYNVQESDTPETIANKYYDDSYRYWIVLYGNPDKLDPQWDWPLNSTQFQNYLIKKYSQAAGGDYLAISYTQSTVYKYEKIVTTTDSDTRTSAVKTIEVDEATYNSIIPYKTVQNFVHSGTSAFQTLSFNVATFDSNAIYMDSNSVTMDSTNFVDIASFDSETVSMDSNEITMDLDTSLYVLRTKNQSTVTYSVDKKATSIYDYEYELNENKRNINIINSVYASQLETQYKSLVNA
jgi:Base plate wedge protein 53